MSAELRRLVAHRAMGLATGEDYVDWAVAALEAGQDSEHLRMLAGLGMNPHWQDVQDYFEWAREELGQELPSVAQAIPLFVSDVAQSIVDGTVAPRRGCWEIYNALQIEGVRVPQEQYEAWLYLEDGLEPGTYQELVGATLTEAIRREAVRLLEAR